MEANDTKFVEAAVKSWQQAVDRATKLFSKLTDEDLEREVAPGRNRLIYLLGHLLAVDDALYAALRLGDRLHPDLDEPFLKSPDKSLPLTSAAELRAAWTVVHDRLASGIATLTPAEWLERHALVSEEDFVKEPHRNRFTLLLGRTGHLAFHLGQVVLVK